MESWIGVGLQCCFWNVFAVTVHVYFVPSIATDATSCFSIPIFCSPYIGGKFSLIPSGMFKRSPCTCFWHVFWITSLNLHFWQTPSLKLKRHNCSINETRRPVCCFPKRSKPPQIKSSCSTGRGMLKNRLFTNHVSLLISPTEFTCLVVLNYNINTFLFQSSQIANCSAFPGPYKGTESIALQHKVKIFNHGIYMNSPVWDVEYFYFLLGYNSCLERWNEVQGCEVHHSVTLSRDVCSSRCETLPYLSHFPSYLCHPVLQS